MAIVKLLNCGDFHDHEEMHTLDATVQLANTIEADAMVYTGDLLDAKKYASELAAEQEKYKAKIQEIQKSAKEKIDGSLDAQEKKDIIASQQLQELGGIQSLEKMLQESNSEEQNKQITDFLNQIKGREKNIQAAKQKHDKLIKHEFQALQKIEQASIEPIVERINKFYSKANEKLAQMNTQKLFVRGNHDTDSIYGILNSVHFLETGPVNLKGLKIAGAPNTNERIPGLPEELFQSMMEDAFGASLEDYLKQHSEEKLKKLPVYQRLQGEEIDILVTHKGLDKFSYRTNEKGKSVPCGFGMGLAKIVQEKKPQIIVCGHMHSFMYSPEHGYAGIRVGPKTACVTHIDTETKEIEKIDVYERVGAT